MKPFLGVVAASVFVLAACSSHPSIPQAKVPTLTVSGASSAQSDTGSSDPGAGRPRERLDMTQDDRQALSQAYMQCLSANGYDKARNGRDQATLSRAQEACISKLPLPPWEFDVNNPHASDFVHAVVLCLRGKGVRYVDEGTPTNGRYGLLLGGPGNDSESISKGMQLAPECEKDVAARGIGR
jgi:hypothetical protein